jgi:hypothetical protein
VLFAIERLAWRLRGRARRLTGCIDELLDLCIHAWFPDGRFVGHDRLPIVQPNRPDT